ncbi:MAG: transmembrane 220 family protein [Spongiibacteraceae bacterium]
MQMAKTIFLVFSALMFSVFAYLQINDAAQYGNFDAWSWVLLYGITALLSLLLLRLRLNAAILHIWLGFAVGSLYFHIQDDTGNFHFDRLDLFHLWNAQGEMIQQTNEAGGLLFIVLGTLAFVAINRARVQ